GLDVVGGLAGAAGSQGVAELQQRRFQKPGRLRNGLAGKDRNAAGQLGGQVLGREGQPWQSAGIERVAGPDHDGEELLLKLDGGSQIRTRRAQRLPSPAGEGLELIVTRLRNGDERHMLETQQVSRVRSGACGAWAPSVKQVPC